jgi:hypothetical protein
LPSALKQDNSFLDPAFGPREACILRFISELSELADVGDAEKFRRFFLKRNFKLAILPQPFRINNMVQSYWLGQSQQKQTGQNFKLDFHKIPNGILCKVINRKRAVKRNSAFCILSCRFMLCTTALFSDTIF